MNYADVGRNHGEKSTNGMAACMELTTKNDKVVITQMLQMLAVIMRLYFSFQSHYKTNMWACAL